MRNARGFKLGLLVSLLAAGCGDDDSSDDAGAGDAGSGSGACTVTLEPGSDDQTNLQGALIEAESGDTVCLRKGVYKLSGQLSLATERVTVRGAADNATVLDFSEQTSGANGIELSADHDTLENLTVKNPKGDGVRATSVDYPTLRNVRVEWAEASTSNGGYGLYPVMSSHVLIENCYVSGASDAGIYVGQSHDIIVRNSEATGNVAGIEIENSTDADVHDNHVHGNTGGILVFNLPGLSVKDGKRAKVHDNIIEDNNHANFAAEGGIIATLPVGTGVFVLASDDNELSDNTIRNHQSTGISIISWHLALRDDDGKADPDYDWYPERNYIHGNNLSDNGSDPKDNALLIASLVGEETLADLVWDGINDGDKPENASLTDGVPPESLRNCFRDNGSASFMNLDVQNDGAGKSSDVGPFECTRDPLPAIEL